MSALVVLALIAAPAGWTGGANRELVEQTGRVAHFGGVHGVIEAERYDAPSAGVVLYVTRVAANIASPSDAAAAEVQTIAHGTPSVEAKDKALDVQTSWRDGDVAVTSRMIIAATADRIVAVKGECYEGTAAAALDVKHCIDALAALDPGIAAKDRVGLAVPTATAPAATPSTLTTPSLTDSHVSMPPMAVHQDAPGPDRRPVYVGAGLIVIAAIFWWNRRRAAHDR